MRIEIDFSALRKTKWHEYAVRFVFGGSVTAVAAIIAAKCGPVIGGLFLACPAIFPASATLIDKHEKQSKQRLGLHGTDRGRQSAGVDAAGAAMGSIGLAVFGAIIWKFLLQYSSWAVLLSATFGWLLISISLWQLRKRDQIFFRWLGIKGKRAGH